MRSILSTIALLLTLIVILNVLSEDKFLVSVFVASSQRETQSITPFLRNGDLVKMWDGAQDNSEVPVWSGEMAPSKEENHVTPTSKANDNAMPRDHVGPVNIRPESASDVISSGLSLQEVAHNGLQKLNESAAFRLAGIQSMQEISDQAIVRAWDPCTLPRGRKKFQAIILGGSASARPSNNCYVTADQRPEEGRYSDILQHKLRELGVDATIHNMAQGATTSAWNGMMLEQLVDHSQDIDLLIWEHAINDYARYNGNTADQMLAFWLARVEHLYRKQHRAVPPILIAYFWRQGMGGVGANDIRKNGIGYQGPLPEKSLQVVDAYRERLPIQVLNVANVIDPQQLIDHRRAFIDDEHHPACQASHLIADVLQYVLFTHSKVENECEESPTAVLPDTTSRPAANATLMDILLDSHTTISTLSHWQPALPNRQSLVTPQSLQTASVHEAMYAADKNTPGRSDRKVSYQIPACSSPIRLDFTLASNDWQWLCVVYKGSKVVASIDNGAAEIQLTGQGLTMAKLGGPINDFRQHKNFEWLDLRNYNTGMVSFCDNATENERFTPPNITHWSWIHFLAGVKA